MKIASAPDSTSAAARSAQSSPTPTAPPHRNRPRASFAAFVNIARFLMSCVVIIPVSLPAAFTSGSFSIRCR